MVLVEARGGFAASRPWRERQPSPGDGGDDERKRYGPVIVANELKVSAQTSTLSRPIR
jgi:hypothetical protein